MTSGYTLRYLPKRYESICSDKVLYKNIHISFVFSSPKLETVYQQMNWKTYSFLLLSNENKGL